MYKIYRAAAAMLMVLLASPLLQAQVIITSTSSSYTQNFNTLAVSGTSSVLPAGWRLLETGTNANTTLAADAGTSTTGNTYSYGTGTGTDRAFGGLLSGSLSPTIGAQFLNNTGATITSITISYTGEQWRCGSTGRADRIDFQYSTSATSLSTGTWTDVNTLDFSSLSTTTTGAKDGNAAANRAAKTTIITGLSIANNTSFWIRWSDFDATGADDGLAVDDFSLQMSGADITPPAATILNPVNGAANIALSGNLVVTFSENIQKGSAGNIDVKRVSDNTVVQTTAVTNASVLTSTNTATIPFSGLANSVAYYVEITAGAFRDLAGNNYAGITGAVTWSFTTLAPAGPALAVSPVSLAFGTIAAGSSSAAQTFAFSSTGITGSLTVTAPTGFELSADGITFNSSLIYTQAEAIAGQIIFVRFSPGIANTTYGGTVNFVSTGLNSNQETLSGNSNTGGSGPLNFYFGNLHSHSSYSDGNADNTTKIPADDYAFAKTSLCMDFLGISEHNHATAGMHIADWAPGAAQATAATTATFVAMHGMEWGVISGGGHVVVYGMDSLVGWEAGNYQVFVQKSVYRGAGGLFDILNKHGGNALGYLAHPNTTDYNNILGSTFDVDADNAIVGSAVESGPAFSTNTTYTNPGTSMSYLSYYKNMLAKGYHLGPTIDHDNHNMTFGHTAKTRLVVLAPSLSENTLLDGIRKMRFYASEDCGARITYTINTQPIGSIITQAGAPTITVNSVTTAAVSSISVMAGVPGSGTAATVLSTSTSGNFTYTDNTLANLGQRYYYLDITEVGGSRIITSPIWYTRNDAALRYITSVTSLFSINEEDRVTLKWTTENEEAGQSFEVQRSADGGNNFYQLGLLEGKGRAATTETYALTDMHPVEGISYYRLVQRNSNGSLRYSDTRVINRSKQPASYFTVYPNPVQGILNIRVSAVTSNKTVAEIFDISGRRIFAKAISLEGGEETFGIDMSGLSNGTYMLKMNVDGKVIARLVNKF